MSEPRSRILPEIHSSGIFTLKEPYTGLLNSGTWYTCIAVRKIEEAKLMGDDVFGKVYDPVGLSKQIYEEDYRNGISIITVKSSTGDVKKFPSSYLLSYPSNSGVRYTVIGMGINLGSLPVDFNLSELKKAVTDVVSDKIGVTAAIKLINLSPVSLVSHENHLNYERVRAAKVKTQKTMLTRNHELADELTKLRQENEALKKFISDNRAALGDAVVDRLNSD